MEFLWFSRAIFFILGTVVGSFLNVCIVRLPKGESVVAPGSHCVSCQKPIAWFDNIPLFSYVALGGKCRYCQAKFSPRYLGIEFLTGIAFVGFWEAFGWQAVLIPYLFLVSGFIIATFVDFEHRIIPDEVSLGGLVAGILFSAFIPALHDTTDGVLSAGRWIALIMVGLCLTMYKLMCLFQKPAAATDPRTGEISEEPREQEDLVFYVIVLAATAAVFLLHFAITKFGAQAPVMAMHLLSLEASLIGFLVGGGTIFAMGMLGEIIFRKEAMGGGDVKLLAMIGAFLGWKNAILTFFISPLFGAVVGILIMLRTKEKAIAYGPYIVLGALISLFFSEIIINWILNGYGLN